jgi:hypothetical protein
LKRGAGKYAHGGVFAGLFAVPVCNAVAQCVIFEEAVLTAICEKF